MVLSKYQTEMGDMEIAEPIQEKWPVKFHLSVIVQQTLVELFRSNINGWHDVTHTDEFGGISHHFKIRMSFVSVNSVPEPDRSIVRKLQHSNTTYIIVGKSNICVL